MSWFCCYKVVARMPRIIDLFITTTGYTITEQKKGRYVQVGKELYKKGCVDTVEAGIKV